MIDVYDNTGHNKKSTAHPIGKIIEIINITLPYESGQAL